MKRVYYYLEFVQLSPLRIGDGQHEKSDNDLMVDGRGLPFIPGTSLAGIFRHRAIKNGMSKKEETRLFGDVIIQTGKGTEQTIESSSIIFGDAILSKEISKEKIIFTRRDGVGLGEWGTTKRGSKFDFEVAETDCKFESIIEWSGTNEQYTTEITKIIDPILKHYIADGIRVGARTSRGYGNFKLNVRKKVFNFPNDLDTWINFKPYSVKEYEGSETIVGELNPLETKLDIEFEMISPFSVRVNTAKCEITEDGSVPDTIPMENFRGNPVIPGTVWAGAFRHHMQDLLRDTGITMDSEEIQKVDALFGYDEKSKSLGKSKISFSESEILIDSRENQKLSVVRTAIDRFTASPRDAALFTNKVYFGGNGILNISFEKNHVDDKELQLLAACICDLHLGFITIGGEASVGRGIMQVTSIKCNGIDKTEQMRDSVENGGTLTWLKEN